MPKSGRRSTNFGPDNSYLSILTRSVRKLFSGSKEILDESISGNLRLTCWGWRLYLKSCARIFNDRDGPFGLVSK